jgi:stress response protein YsnF
MSSTVIGVFEDGEQARQTEQELRRTGFLENIRVVDGPGDGDGHQSLWDEIKELFGFGGAPERFEYEEATRRGGIVVAADVDDDHVEDAVAIIARHHPIDMDQRVAQWQAGGWTSPGTDAGTTARPAAATGGEAAAARTEAIPVVEESLKVGTRSVNRGGVRVRSRVSERPVEETVTLREEKVDVQRRAVDRPVHDADQAFQERTIEARETGQEAVVAKEARVVEEVVVGTRTEQRDETVRDTVRRTDVDVEPLQADAVAHGRSMAAEDRFRGRDWAAAEPEARRSWEERNPGQWDRYREHVRRGYAGSADER